MLTAVAAALPPALPIALSLENSLFLCKETRDECSRAGRGLWEKRRAGGRTGSSLPLFPPLLLLLTPVVRHVPSAVQLALRDSCSFLPRGPANTAWLEGERGLGLPQEAPGPPWEGIAFFKGGEMFLSPVLSSTHCCFDSCITSVGIFLLSHQVMESFWQPPPLALEQITCRVACAGLEVQAGGCTAWPPGPGNGRKRGWGAWGCTDPPSSLPGFDPGAAGEGEEGLSSSSGHKSSHHPGPDRACSI